MVGDAMPAKPTPAVASAMAIGAGVVWSFGAIMAKKADGADAFQYLVWRSIGIIVVVETMALVRRRPPQTLKAWTGGRTMALANVGLFVASIAFVYAVKTTTPANAAFLGSLTPLVAVVLSRFLGERMSRATLVALAVGFCGLVITVLGDLQAGNMVGNAAALAASVGFAVYTICVRSDGARDWSPVLPGYGLLMIVVCSAVTIAQRNTLVPPAVDMAYALLHGAVFIVVGTLLFNAASKHVPAVPMTVFAQAEMVFVPVWAFLVLGSRPTALTVLGGVIIFAAVIGKALHEATTSTSKEFVGTPDVPLL